MEASDVIAGIAIVITLGAACISTHQAKSAKQSADQAEAQVAVAREANRLTRLQIDQQSAKDNRAAREAEQASQREAEKVNIRLGTNGVCAGAGARPWDVGAEPGGGSLSASTTVAVRTPGPDGHGRAVGQRGLPVPPLLLRAAVTG